MGLITHGLDNDSKQPSHNSNQINASEAIVKQFSITAALILGIAGCSTAPTEPEPKDDASNTPVVASPAPETPAPATEEPAPAEPTEATPTAPVSEKPAKAVIKPRKTPLTVKGLTQRHEFLGNLVERSSSAKQIKKSGTAEALKLHQDAINMRADAKKAIDAGDLEKADTLLRETTHVMMKAVRLASPHEVTAQKEKADFDNRRSSVEVLLSTGKRVAKEKSAARPEFDKAEELLKEADALGAKSDYVKGKKKLDLAYGLVKNSLRNMREGEQLVADKNFATKADEYKYEQSRNDDYVDLISGVIEGQTDPSWKKMADKALALRVEADALTKSGNYEAALKKINESTAQYKNILRRSGFPIV